MLAIVYIMKRW